MTRSRPFKPRPEFIYREEDHTPGRGSVRTTFDVEQYESWRRSAERFPEYHPDTRFFIGQIEWRDAA